MITPSSDQTERRFPTEHGNIRSNLSSSSSDVFQWDFDALEGKLRRSLEVHWASVMLQHLSEAWGGVQREGASSHPNGPAGSSTSITHPGQLPGAAPSTARRPTAHLHEADGAPGHPDALASGARTAATHSFQSADTSTPFLPYVSLTPIHACTSHLYFLPHFIMAPVSPKMGFAGLVALNWSLGRLLPSANNTASRYWQCEASFITQPLSTFVAASITECMRSV